MARWRLIAVAGLSWFSTAVVLAFDLSGWLLLLPAATCLSIAVVWKSQSLMAVSMTWILLSSFGWVQLDYQGLSSAQIQDGVQQRTFEVLGVPRPIGAEFLTTIALSPQTSDRVKSIGLLWTSEPPIQGGTYRGWLDIDGSEAPLQREVFRSSVRGELELVEQPDQISNLVIQLRRSFHANLTGLTPDAAGLVAGLAIGDDSMVSPALKQQMTSLSLSHLVAVSGANLAIVAGGAFLLAALLGAGRKSRILVAAIVSSFYVLLVGPEPSVVRAALMALAVLAGQATGRGNQSLNSLGLAVIVLVNVDPLLALEFGFALSVFATLGLLVLAPALYQKFKLRMASWLAASLAVAVAAQLFTLPVLLMLENRIATYSVIANMLAEPVVAPVTVLGMVAVLVSTPFPWLSSVIAWLSSLGTAWIEFLANTLSALPLISIPWIPQPYSTMAGVLIAITITLYVISNRPVWSMLLLVCLIPTTSWTLTDLLRSSTWPGEDWQVISCDVGQGDATLIRSTGQTLLIDTGREPELLLSCLDRAQVSQIDLLVLSHFDADHVAAVPELVSEVHLESVMVSGFVDDRPLVELVMDALKESGAAIHIGQANLSFKLGEGEVTILQPSLTAREATDSNDASLVLRADFPEFSFLALGDLGGGGQNRLLKSQAAAMHELSNANLVLKVSHHGSADQSKSLLKKLKPDFSLISAGVGNPYGHPRREAIDLLIEVGSDVLRTDTLGSIALSIDSGVKLSVAGKL